MLVVRSYESATRSGSRWPSATAVAEAFAKLHNRGGHKPKPSLLVLQAPNPVLANLEKRRNQDILGGIIILRDIFAME